MSRFEQCLNRVLRFEGGYVDHPSDPGGATNFGITRKTLARWRGVSPWWKLPRSEVRSLKRIEVRAIYRALYWDRCRASVLPAGLDLAVFDFAVNSGPVRALRHLQALLAVRRDGVVGPVTLRALERMAAERGVRWLIGALFERREAFLRRLANFAVFGRGWMKRTREMRRAALAHTTDIAQPVTERKVPMQILPGYKTYIVAIAMLIAGIGQMLGVDLPGFDGQASAQLIFEAFAIMFLRKGFKNDVANA